MPEQVEESVRVARIGTLLIVAMGGWCSAKAAQHCLGQELVDRRSSRMGIGRVRRRTREDSKAL